FHLYLRNDVALLSCCVANCKRNRNAIARTEESRQRCTKHNRICDGHLVIRSTEAFSFVCNGHQSDLTAELWYIEFEIRIAGRIRLLNSAPITHNFNSLRRHRIHTFRHLEIGITTRAASRRTQLGKQQWIEIKRGNLERTLLIKEFIRIRRFETRDLQHAIIHRRKRNETSRLCLHTHLLFSLRPHFLLRSYLHSYPPLLLFHLHAFEAMRYSKRNVRNLMRPDECRSNVNVG